MTNRDPVTSTLLALAVLVAAMVAVVGVTLVLENWRRWRPPVPEVDQRASPPAGHDVMENLDVVDVELVFADRAAADRLVAVLFASIAAGRGPDADRVAAWVTASDWPPGAFGGEFRPGADLRGRPAAVRRLLDRDDDGRCWVTLRTSVDIAKGLAMRPPRGEELAGVLPLWAATRSASGQLDRGSCETMAVAIDRLEQIWAPTVAAVEVQSLRRAVGEVLASGAPDAALALEVSEPARIAPAPVPGVDPERPEDDPVDTPGSTAPVGLAS